MVNLPGALTAVILATLAVVVFRTRRSDGANRTLAVFLLAVAANSVLVGIADTLTPWGIGEEIRPPAARAFQIAAFAIQILDPVALVWFAGVFPRRTLLSRPAARGVVIAIAAAMELLLLLNPAAIVTPNTPQRFAFEAYVLGTYVVVLGALLAGEFRQPSPIAPRGYLLGWAVLVLYRGVLVMELALRRAIPVPDSLIRVTAISLGLAAGLAFTAALFGALGLAATPNRRADVRRLGLLVALWLAGLAIFVRLPQILGYATLVWTGSPPGAASVPLFVFMEHAAWSVRWWFFALVAGPAFLSNQIFDLDVRLRRGLLYGVVAGILLVLLGAGTLLVSSGITDRGDLPVRTVLVLGVLVLVATQSARIGRRVADRYFPPERERDEAYRRLRRFEVYREAARSVGEGRAPASDLERLREALGLSAEEARLATAASARSEAPQRPLEPGVVLAGRYEIVRAIARGGHGRVFLARDRRDSGEVAVKEVATTDGAAALGRIEAEIRAAKLTHPNLLPARDHFLVGTSAFLVSEFMSGGSLADVLRARGKLAPGQAVKVAVEVLRGLEAAHAEGVLHRDVKPANVLFDAGGRARLGDFGVALVKGSGETETTLLDPRVPGTLAYLPPEMLTGTPPDPRGDLYSLGTLLFEAIAGRLPLPNERAPAGLPGALVAIIARARAPDPQRRYRSAREMREALEALVH